MKGLGEHLFVDTLSEQVMDPALRKQPGPVATPASTGDDMDHDTSPAHYAAESRIFAEAALRMLEAGETRQASLLFARAAAYARLAA